MGIKQLIVYLDILTFAKSESKLEEVTKQVIKRLQDKNFTMNKTKSEFNKKEIVFIGFQLTNSSSSLDDFELLPFGLLK